jgi:hypothetical protein
LVGSSRPDELVLALVALNEGGVDRRGEGRIVELEREAFGTRLASGPAPTGSELDTVGGDAIVGRLVVVAVAGLDAGRRGGRNFYGDFSVKRISSSAFLISLELNRARSRGCASLSCPRVTSWRRNRARLLITAPISRDAGPRVSPQCKRCWWKSTGAATPDRTAIWRASLRRGERRSP